jgi:DNA polymerase III alpha subunit (gram-positive type)
MNYKHIFFDTETTGITNDDYLCQIAWKQGGEDTIESGLFKPPIPISIDSMAVCHVTNKMVKDMPAFKDSDLWNKFNVMSKDKKNVFIAHNAKFDIGMLKREGIEITEYIDTLKIAQFIDREGLLPKYNLQYLRYYYNIEIEAIAHDARGDIVVLEAVFKFLRDKVKEITGQDGDELTKQMITISYEPLLIKTFMFGKHNGKAIADVASVDPGYLEWLLAQKIASQTDTEEDWIYTLKHYLKRS